MTRDGTQTWLRGRGSHGDDYVRTVVPLHRTVASCRTRLDRGARGGKKMRSATCRGAGTRGSPAPSARRLRARAPRANGPFFSPSSATPSLTRWSASPLAPS